MFLTADVVQAEEVDVQIRTLTLEPPVKLQGDEPTYTYPLGSWGYHQKLRQLRLIIQLGFELSVYSPEELPGMYWYLSHICSTHLAHLDRIRSCVTAAFQRTELSARGRTNRQPELDAAKRRQAFNRTFSLVGRLTTELVWIDAFAIALHCLYALLDRHNILPSHSSNPPQSYSSESLRYELRMKPFLPVSHPEFIPFELFKQESTLEAEKDEIILERALNAIGEARKMLEKYLADGPYLPFDASQEIQGDKKTDTSRGLGSDWVKDVKDSLRACIGTSIALGTLKKALSSVAPSSQESEDAPASKDRHSKLNLSVEIPDIGSKGRWHDWWAVPQLSEKLPLR